MPSPVFDVEKSVTVDGGTVWIDADAATGPTLLASGDTPQFKFVVTNTGNVTLSGVTLVDDDLDTAACDPAVPANLAVGASFTCVLTGAWGAGQQTDTASASGSFTDDRGGSATRPDTDSAHYFGAVVSITIDKEGTLADWWRCIATVGDIVSYTFDLKNTGNVTAHRA